MAKQSLVYIGTYTRNNPSLGIYVYRYDPASGALEFLSTAPKVDSPSYLATSPDGRFLYAVNENDNGVITSFAIDRDKGMLRLLNQQSTHGAHPCHLALDRTGKWVIVANYSSGNVAVFPVEIDGSLGPATDVLQQKGTGPNAARQEGPHAHSVTFDPAGRFLVVADLGADKVFTYTLDTTKGKLVPAKTASVSMAPGSGPRHFAFHRSGKFAYAINELLSTITVLAYDGKEGSFTEIQTISTLPEGWKGSSTCADIDIHPGGKFLYGSNRGHDSIAMFAIDQRTGKLTSLGQEPIRGKTPRNFALSKDGRYLLVGGQETNNIVAFAVDPVRGRLTPTGKEWPVPAPVCILFQE